MSLNTGPTHDLIDDRPGIRPLRWAIRLMIWRRTRYLRRLGRPGNPGRDQIAVAVISSPLSLSVHHKYTGTAVLVFDSAVNAIDSNRMGARSRGHCWPWE